MTFAANRPRSAFSGYLQKLSGCKAGVTDVFVLYSGKPIFLELKSRSGIASARQKEFRLEVLAGGGMWWMARSVNAALTALARSGVVFRRRWKPPRLEPWEGPFADPNRRLPQAPDEAERQREARRRWREPQRARKAAKLAAERDDAADAEIAA